MRTNIYVFHISLQSTEITNVKPTGKGKRGGPDAFKMNRRPATNLRTGPFTYPILDETKYTTDSPAPIVLRTRGDSPVRNNERLSSAKSNKSNDRNNLKISNQSQNILPPEQRDMTKSPTSRRRRRQGGGNDIELLSITKKNPDDVVSRNIENTNIPTKSSVIIEVEKQTKSTKSDTGKNERGKIKTDDVEEDINNKPLVRRSRRHARQRMTDIV